MYSVNVSVRCGCSENARQMRLTVLRLRPDAAPSDGVDQWVASGGVDSSVMVSKRSTSASPTLRGVPDRGSSTSPSSRRSTKRCRHLAMLVNRLISILIPFSSFQYNWVKWPLGDLLVLVQNNPMEGGAFTVVNGREVYTGLTKRWRCPNCTWWQAWECERCRGCGTPRDPAIPEKPASPSLQTRP